MKNIKKEQLKKCIFFILESYERLLHFLGINVAVGVSIDGINYWSDDEDWTDDEIKIELEKYFDVKITSIHADDCDLPGIWIVYKEEEA